ncbi:MAG: cytochrome c biogenesis protein [Calditerrivibrio sp.]|nr:cytochrome c biogenesis protein [Calditerrivibrio sp.]
MSVGFYAFMGKSRYLSYANYLVFIAILSNGLFIIDRWRSLQNFPLRGLADIFAILIFVIGFSSFLLSIKNKKPGIYIFTMPIIIILGIASFAHSSIIIHRAYVQGLWLFIHLPFTIAGTALFALSALFGILYFIQEIQLKRKRFGLLYNFLPSIDMLNKINKNTMLIGFLFFTVGLLSGFIWGLYEWEGRVVLTPKLLFSIITWFIFGSIILIKKTKGMAPKVTAFSSILGIISVIITYVGVALFLKG